MTPPTLDEYSLTGLAPKASNLCGLYAYALDMSGLEPWHVLRS